MSHSPAEHQHQLQEGLQEPGLRQLLVADPSAVLQVQQQRQQQEAPQQQRPQQQHARMQSPFLAAQQLDSGALESFAAHLLEALGRSQLSQGDKQHKQRQRGGLQASCAAAAAGVDAADACAAHYDADADDSAAEWCSGSCTPTCSEAGDLDPDSAHAAVRALLESCLEEAAERARSETAQSSGLYILGADSSLCSSSSIDGPGATTLTSSGAVAIDWDAMLRTELQEVDAGATCDSESAATSDGSQSDGEVQSTAQHSVGPKQES